MSDLAPFVAAILRDQNVDDLLRENQELRERLDLHQRVEITGKEGKPIYYTSSMDRGKPTGSNSIWNVAVEEHEKHVIIPLHELPNLEIRVGGDVRATFHSGNVNSDTDLLTCDFDRENLTEPQMGGIMFIFDGDRGGVHIVYGRFGPVRYEDYTEIGHLHGEDLHAALLDLSVNHGARDLMLKSIDFVKSEIQGTVDIMQRQGIQTDDGTTPEDNLRFIVRMLARRQRVGEAPDELVRALLRDHYDDYVHEDGTIIYDESDEEMGNIGEDENEEEG
jgi:hypothetical protein